MQPATPPEQWITIRDLVLNLRLPAPIKGDSTSLQTEAYYPEAPLDISRPPSRTLFDPMLNEALYEAFRSVLDQQDQQRLNAALPPNYTAQSEGQTFYTFMTALTNSHCTGHKVNYRDVFNLILNYAFSVAWLIDPGLTRRLTTEGGVRLGGQTMDYHVYKDGKTVFLWEVEDLLRL
ncbi:hypothetical protein FRB94_004576 [Tulasnella sp. JGI-2019a]|nr:hypothetical protein FRB93_005610 [Tulasnella sp. JGI-2019a]KAG9001697.1 hypothetical protein FRB94_004576 [Tulasnella sp. JGI-2019a]KAG9030253.1 hypothetical protein FRB95_004189 [Tulasnella sp. JGI-2019a]